MNYSEIKSRLLKPFDPRALDWKAQDADVSAGRVRMVPYLDVRAIRDRIDDVFQGMWQNHFTEVVAPTGVRGVRCEIKALVGEVWLSREDGADMPLPVESATAMKRAYSEAFRRAAVQWGVGQYLYRLAPIYVACDERGEPIQRPMLPARYLPEGFEYPAGFGDVMRAPDSEVGAAEAPVVSVSPEKAEQPAVRDVPRSASRQSASVPGAQDSGESSRAAPAQEVAASSSPARVAASRGEGVAKAEVAASETLDTRGRYGSERAAAPPPAPSPAPGVERKEVAAVSPVAQLLEAGAGAESGGMAAALERLEVLRKGLGDDAQTAVNQVLGNIAKRSSLGTLKSYLQGPRMKARLPQEVIEHLIRMVELAIGQTEMADAA